MDYFEEGRTNQQRILTGKQLLTNLELRMSKRATSLLVRWSSPEINLALRKLYWLLFSFLSPPPPARSGGERSEPERSAGGWRGNFI